MVMGYKFEMPGHGSAALSRLGQSVPPTNYQRILREYLTSDFNEASA